MPRKPPPEETRWKKGQSGNPAGRPKVKTLPEYAREYLEEIDPETGLPRIVSVSKNWVDESLVSPALFLSLLDRLYGKVPNALDLTTKGESMNGEVNRQNVEHRLAALLDGLQKRMNDK